MLLDRSWIEQQPIALHRTQKALSRPLRAPAKGHNRSTSALVAEYRYNGLGFRIGWHYDTMTSGTPPTDGPDGTVNSDDPWYYFCYDERWRIVATFRDSDANPKEVFVYHSAGLDGRGGSSYIDSVILRDRDANTAWTAASDGTLEERRYYCQNAGGWRSDASVILTDTGKMVEWVKYSAYGIAYALPAGDTDSDGDWDATDESNITGAYDVRKDADLSGAVGATDVDHANSITGGYQTLGWNTLTSSAVNNRIGYAGYQFAPELAGNKWHVRNRMLDSFNGIWNRFDPLGYVDGMNLYQYVRGNPYAAIDPSGLCTGGECSLTTVDSCSCVVTGLIVPPPPPPPPPPPGPKVIWPTFPKGRPTIVFPPPPPPPPVDPCAEFRSLAPADQDAIFARIACQTIQTNVQRDPCPGNCVCDTTGGASPTSVVVTGPFLTTYTIGISGCVVTAVLTCTTTRTTTQGTCEWNLQRPFQIVIPTGGTTSGSRQ